MPTIEGRCLCGGVTYSSDAEPAATAICHCDDCQRQSGTAFSVVVVVPRDAFNVSGESLSTYRTVGDDHGQETERHFCSACGSPIYSSSPAMPDAVFVKAGTLDDRSWLEPQLEVWGRSAQPWLEPTEGRPRLERGPSRS
jgi:hypothetical protein